MKFRLNLTVLFLSTPSVWRATNQTDDMNKNHDISIHALRVEGDWYSGRA